MNTAGIVIEGNDFAFLENLENVGNYKATDAENDVKAPSDVDSGKNMPSPYATLTIEQLEKTLQKAIDNEQYETAAKIRDEIEKRKI